MAMKINGLDGDFALPRLIKRYRYIKFSKFLKARRSDGSELSVDVRATLDAAWKGALDRSKKKACNDYFAGLFRKKKLSEILAEGDIVLHQLEPKENYDYSIVPDGNTAGRDIGLDPNLFFDPEPDVLICTLIHELAHVAGASTNSEAPLVEAHAAELALLSCSCKKQYRKTVVGSIQGFGPSGGQYA